MAQHPEVIPIGPIPPSHIPAPRDLWRALPRRHIPLVAHPFLDEENGLEGQYLEGELDNESNPDSDSDTVVDLGEAEEEVPQLIPAYPVDIPPLDINPPPRRPMADAAYLHLFKPERFSGEKNSIGIEDFLDTLEMSLSCLDAVVDEAKRERAKVLALQSHLDGKAKSYWLTLRAEKKATFALAAAALKLRFPARNDEMGGWAEKARSISEMNTMTQGALTSEQYVEKASDLFAILGKEYSIILATKFVDGIVDDTTKIMIDAQFDEAYSFPAVIKAYEKCTKSLRRKEVAARRPEERESTKSDAELMRETVRQNAQMVLQVGEMLKELTLAKQVERQAVNTQRYQPIVGTVAQTSPVSSASYQRAPSNYGRSVVCFTCGQQGHRVFECKATTILPREEQEKLRAAHARAMAPSQAALGSGAGPAAGAGNANTGHRMQATAAHVEQISDEELGIEGETDPQGMMVMSAQMVEIVKKNIAQDKWRLMTAYVNSLSAEEKSQLVAMADKRGRPDEDDMEEAPPTSRPKVSAPEGSGRAPTGASRPAAPPSQAAPPAEGNVPAAPPPMFYQPQSRPFIPDPFYDIPANQFQPQFAPAAGPSDARAKKGKKKATEPKIKRHIKLLQGQEPWDPVEALRRMPVVGLDFGSLMDMAPGARIAVGKALQMEKNVEYRPSAARALDVNLLAAVPPPSRMSQPAVVANTSATGIFRESAPSNVNGVVKEPTCHIINFHTSGEVWGAGYGKGKAYSMGKILIDGGAVVNLMPEKIAIRLGLTLEDNDDIVIRTATDETRPIHKCTTFDLNIAGVVANIKVYVIDIPQSYSLLLGRRWLYQVRAFGDYSSHAYTIYNSKGKPSSVQSTGTTGNIEPLHEVFLNPHKVLPHTALTATEEEEILLGRGKMEAIINRIVQGAESQSQDWETDEESGDESEDNSGNEEQQ